MRTVQMTLDDDLVSQVDNTAKALHTTRSAFTRDALRQALRAARTTALEEKHRRGYALHPVERDEFSVREKDQAWGEE